MEIRVRFEYLLREGRELLKARLKAADVAKTILL
jgi:hypothetical protein